MISFCYHALSPVEPHCVDFVLCRHDTGKDGFIDLMELKLMMEKLGAPQTHLGLKNMIKEVDEDFDGKLSFREVRPQEELLCSETATLNVIFKCCI